MMAAINANPSGMPTPSPIASDLSTPPPPEDDSADWEGELVGDVCDAALFSAVDDRLVDSEPPVVEAGDEEGVADGAELAVEVPPGRNSVLHNGIVVITLLDTLQHV